MLNKAEKIRAFEIDDMVKNIRPLSGMGARTITTMEIGKSWVIHEPLLQYLQMAVNSNLFLAGNDRSRETLQYYQEQYDKAVDNFYHYLGENFKGPSSVRPIPDWF